MANSVQTGVEVAKQAMDVLDFYQRFYSGDHVYQQRHNEVIALLRNRAETFKGGPQHGQYKFLMLFAAALEISNLPGEYVKHPGASA